MRSAEEIHLEGARLSRRILDTLKETPLLEAQGEDGERIIAHAMMLLCCSAHYSLKTPFHHLVRLIAVAWGVWVDEAVDPDVPSAARKAKEDTKKLLEAWEPPKGSKPL